MLVALESRIHNQSSFQFRTWDQEPVLASDLWKICTTVSIFNYFFYNERWSIYHAMSWVFLELCCIPLHVYETFMKKGLLWWNIDKVFFKRLICFWVLSSVVYVHSQCITTIISRLFSSPPTETLYPFNTNPLHVLSPSSWPLPFCFLVEGQLDLEVSTRTRDPSHFLAGWLLYLLTCKMETRLVITLLTLRAEGGRNGRDMQSP